MNLNQLQYFKILAQEEHYTRAAQMLSITQPSLSHAIAQLEEELGTRLFEKKGKKYCAHTLWKVVSSLCGGIFKSARGGGTENQGTERKQRGYHPSCLYLYNGKQFHAKNGAELSGCLPGLPYRLSFYGGNDRRYFSGIKRRYI